MEVKLGKCLCGEPERMETRDGKPVLVRCPLYQALWVNKENGEKEQEWKCSIAWTPLLLIENRASMDACASYMESFRNELIARVDHAARRVAARPRPTVIEAPDAPSE